MLTRLRNFSRRRFVRDTLTLQAGQLALMILAGGAQAIIARALQPELLGLYRLALTQFGLLALLNIAGAALITRNRLAQAFGADDPGAIRDSLGWFLKTHGLINLTLATFFFFAFPVIAGEAGELARWLAFTVVLDIPFGMVGLILAARRTLRPLVIRESQRVFILSMLQIGAALAVRVDWLIGVQLAVSVAYCLYSIYDYQRIARNDPRIPSWREIFGLAWRAPLTRHLRQGVIVSLDKNLSAFTVDTLPLLILGAYSQSALGLFTTAYQVITFPSPLISGIARNLETYLPFKAKEQADFRSAFVRATLASSLLWSIATVGLAFVAPFVLLILFGFGYVSAIELLYPLLLQSLAVGFGVGLGSAFRTLDKSQYSILESIVVTAIMLPVGVWLIYTYGAYGAAWFVGLQWLINALVAVGLILWFTWKKQAVKTVT
jgi:O-antigen/teichoic acid export membrane protein